MRSQLNMRDSQIHELRRLYKDAHDSETHNAKVVQQLRAQVARYEGCNMPSSPAILTHIGGRQQQQLSTELQDRIALLESQLRFVYILNAR